MKRLLKVVCLAIVAFFAATALAQSPAPRPFAQAELDQMLAPIALYPDSLLSQILMAATYPRDVADAAAWSRANRGLRGESAVRAAQNEPWDPSVVPLTAFPEVLDLMDERRGWTVDLGQAFLEQREQVMDTVQELRARADAAGTLRGSEEIVVRRDEGYYMIEPPSPEVVYVPYYDPRYAYGSWWWPDYPPVYWSPWSGYYYRPGYAGFGWGYGVVLGSGFFFGAFDWPHRYLRYAHQRPWYYHGRDYRRGDRWTHDGRRHRDGDPRWANRDPRWDGSRDRWRDGNRDHGRDGNRDRWRDGNRDRWRDGQRPPVASNPPQATARPTEGRVIPPATAQPGFFAPQANEAVARNPATRPAPRYPTAQVAPRYPTAPQVQAAPAPQYQRPQVQHYPRAPAPQYRQAPTPQYQRAPTPQPQIQRAPAPQTYAAPVIRPAPAPAPAQHQAPAQERAPAAASRNPAERPAR